jgi:CBS domain-containing protein
VRAGQLAVPYPTVKLESSALEAARLLSEHLLPGLIVVDDDDHPRAVLPGSQILRLAIPRYVQDDPALARVYDEAHADRLCARLADKKVVELLPAETTAPPIVPPDATVIEVATLMADAHSPVVAVVAEDGSMVGAITTSHLLSRLLPS